MAMLGELVSPAELLSEAESLERSGAVAEATARYARAAEAAEQASASEVLARTLRRLAVLRHHQGEKAAARELCRRSFEVARSAGADLLAAEALNVAAGLAYEGGEMEKARATYAEALALGGNDQSLRARVEQNLGILSNIQGDLSGALEHYQHSLDAYTALGDERGCGLVLHNLGMLCADRQLWSDADGHFRRSRAIAEAVGDLHLAALCALNHSEVHFARGEFERAREGAETALATFERLGSRLDKADAYRVIGMAYRESGRFTLAESRLRAAQEIAGATGSTLGEAEACRELALLFQATGRNQEALTHLTTAYRLFSRLDARLDLVDVERRRGRLERTYLDVVRGWGQSIESADSYTFGHCERVAHYAVTVARAMGLDDETRATVRVAAYLHDVGKIRVPHEILSKNGPLTDEEFTVIQQHPVWGVELLDGIDFPWNIRPIIRGHHEKYDGSGYPDRLAGDSIPIGAQVLCIADVYDALTTSRSYRPALTHETALSEMADCRQWWSPAVYEAFMRSFAGTRVAA
jgi:putative nucleotidyltransferase with HDIG domain